MNIFIDSAAQENALPFGIWLARNSISAVKQLQNKMNSTKVQNFGAMVVHTVHKGCSSDIRSTRYTYT